MISATNLILHWRRLFSGIYSGIFATYLQYQISVKSVNKRPTIIFCSLCILYVLSVIIVSMDISQFVHYVSKNLLTNRQPFFFFLSFFSQARSGSKIKMLYPTHMSSAMLSGCCDFIAQSILVRIRSFHPWSTFFLSKKDLSLLDCLES